jgi:DNA invertase Pin-like site-specific DNA recombinase
MRAIAYLRVSKEQQATEGVSLDAQRQRIEAWCVLNDATLDPADVFIDAGISGKRSDNRPDLHAALDAACSSGGVLIVYSLSRLARSTRDTIDIAERLEKAGADLVSLTEKIDTTSAAGKMIFRILAVLAEFERDQTSERTKDALRYKKSISERVGSTPYGYDLFDDGKRSKARQRPGSTVIEGNLPVTLVPNPAEADAIERMKQLRDQGFSYRGIAEVLDRSGIPPKSGGSKWSHTSVRLLVQRAVSA